MIFVTKEDIAMVKKMFFKKKSKTLDADCKHGDLTDGESVSDDK